MHPGWQQAVESEDQAHGPAVPVPQHGRHAASSVVLQVKYLPTQHMPSGVLTKSLSVELHRRHTVVLLGIARLRWEERVEQVRQQKDTAAEDKKRAVVSVGAYKHKPKRQKSR